MAIVVSGVGEGDADRTAFAANWAAEFSNSFAGEVVGLGVTFGIDLVGFCSRAWLLVLVYWLARYAPTGIDSRMNI